jgi:DNA-binding NarL/FixJ family response regulator
MVARCPETKGVELLMVMPTNNSTYSNDDAAVEKVPLARLTPREWEVLKLLAAGKTNKEIAWLLRITVNTAKKHVSQVLSKLNVSSRMEAALLYIRSGTTKGKE